MDAHRTCENPKCCGKATLWLRGDEVYRVTSRKDEWGEVQSFDGKPGWICNTCRYLKKQTSDWIVEGITNISRHSVIAANKYKELTLPNETLTEVMNGQKPKMLMHIHNISEVNRAEVHLSEIEGPAVSDTFNGNPHASGHNVTDIKIGVGPNPNGTDSTNPNI